MKRRGQLERRTPLRSRRRRAIGTADQRLHFKRQVTHGATCEITDDGRHDGELQAHHVTPQAEIREWARETGATERELASRLWDPRNGLAVCRRHHDRHTLATRRIPLRLVTRAARQFARELGREHLLARHYRETDDTKEAAC